MTEKKVNNKPIWEKPAPKGKRKKTLTPEEKAEAKERAEKAGRRCPNLIDNMAVLANRGKR